MNTTMTPMEQLEAYAAVAWRPEDLIEVRALPTERDGGPRPSSFWTKAGELAGHVERLAAMNAEGLNVYAGILPRLADGGTKDADTAAGRVVWADFDRTGPRAAWQAATDAGMPAPSMAVNSGHGAHLFWALTDAAAPADIGGLVGDMAALLGSDSTVKNPSRILRLPGLTNHKPPVAPCILLYADAARRYTFADLRARVPTARLEHAHAPSVAAGSQDALTERARRCVARIDGAAEGRRNSEAFRVAALVRNDFGLPDGDAWELLCAWNGRNTPPLGESELRSVFASGAKYARHTPGEKAAASCRGSHVEPAPVIPTAVTEDDLVDMRGELDAQKRGERRTLPLPWKRVGTLSQALRPGTLCVIAGPAGTGKSFFTLAIAQAVHGGLAPWRYLPLEDRRTDLKFRLLAMLAGDYSMIEVDEAGAAAREKALEMYGATVADMAAFVCENPRVGNKDGDGKTVVPPLPHEAVTDWIGRAVGEGARVVFVDPVSQIEFDGQEPWKAEAHFVRRTLALAGDSGATVVLVAHTIKRGGRSAGFPLTLEDIQGSAMIGRLCQCALILDAHDPKESTVYRAAGMQELVEHNRTLTIAKARNGCGTGQRVAFRQEVGFPEFSELGVIAPAGRTKA